MGKFRIRKIESFTINPNICKPFRKNCEKYNRNASREVERFMKRYVKRR